MQKKLSLPCQKQFQILLEIGLCDNDVEESRKQFVPQAFVHSAFYEVGWSQFSWNCLLRLTIGFIHSRSLRNFCELEETRLPNEIDEVATLQESLILNSSFSHMICADEFCGSDSNKSTTVTMVNCQSCQDLRVLFEKFGYICLRQRN